MTTSKEIFGRNLRDRLIAKNKSQNDLARYLGVTPTAVSRWVNGEAMPRAKMIDRICAFLVCPVEDLMVDHSRAVVLAPQDVIADEIHANPRLFQLFVSAIGAEDKDIVHCIEYLNGARK